jgi:transcriptional regulator with XRE-family HTH domain
MKIGEVLRIFRIVRGISITEAAKEIGMSSSNLSETEAGRKGSNIDKIERLAKVYGVRPSQLVGVFEKSEENQWDYTRTLYEATIEWFKTNNPAYLEEVMKKGA